MRYLFICLFCMASIPSHAHKFDEAINENNISLVSRLIDEGHDVNNYNYENESSPLVDSITSGNLQILLLLLEAGAHPNEYMISRGGTNSKHPLLYATTLSQIVLLLAYGATPHTDNSWEYNEAIADNRFLHLLVYYLWNFEDKPRKPETIEQLNEIIFQLPILRIQAYMSLLAAAHALSDFCPQDQKFLKNAYILP